MDQQSTRDNLYDRLPLWQLIAVGVILAAIIGGLIYFFAFKNNKITMSATPLPDATVNQSSNSAEFLVNGEMTVTYTDSGFSPSTLSVTKGTTVSFRNMASRPVHVASDPHPGHDGYPTTGGCVGSTFDICNDIWPSQSWSFTFDAPGSWGYHNHLEPSEGGTIVVQ